MKGTDIYHSVVCYQTHSKCQRQKETDRTHQPWLSNHHTTFFPYAHVDIFYWQNYLNRFFHIYFQISVNLYCTFRFCLSTSSIAFSPFASPQNKHLRLYYLLICCWNAKVECSSNVCCTISEINSIHAKYQLIHSKEYKIDPDN